MSRTALAVTLVILAAAAHAQEVFRSGVDGVVIPVSVRAGNKPVAGLTAADFELRDNGVAQNIRSVSAEDIPIDVTLLLDISSSVDGQLLERLKGAVADTAGLLREGDRMRLIAVSQVLREVFSLRPKTGAMPLDSLLAEGATSLYDGLAATMMRRSEMTRRQLIVAFTDGRDTTSIIDEGGVKAIARLTDAVVTIVVPVAGTADEISRRLTQRRGSIDTLAGGSNVTVNGQGPAAFLPESAPPILAELVAPTGGRIVTLAPDASVSRAFKASLDEFRAGYVLQYEPQGVAAPGWHEVEVTVKRRGQLDVRARRGYQVRGTIGSVQEKQ